MESKDTSKQSQRPIPVDKDVYVIKRLEELEYKTHSLPKALELMNVIQSHDQGEVSIVGTPICPPPQDLTADKNEYFVVKTPVIHAIMDEYEKLFEETPDNTGTSNKKSFKKF